MTYTSIVQMAGSATLLSRVAAAAADEGQADPNGWAQKNIWAIVTTEGWAEAWDYALNTATDDVNPDTGARPGVINDDMIGEAVRSTLLASPS